MIPGDRVRLKRESFGEHACWSEGMEGVVASVVADMGLVSVRVGNVYWLGQVSGFERVSPIDKHIQCRHCGIALVDCEYHR